MPSLYIVDLFSLIFRAYYAVRPLSAPDGTPVQAVYGVATMLKKLIESRRPDRLVVCIEGEGPTFREKIFPEYKANREEPPEDLSRQIELILEYVRAYPLPTLGLAGYEADDLIAAIVGQNAPRPGAEIYIVSSDKDLMQLVSENVFLYDTMKDRVIGRAEVAEKFGVPPEKVADVQGLSGDPSDNIPGIPGVGPKTAAKLVLDYGDFEGVLAHAGDIPGKLGEKVRDGVASARLSRKLVELAGDAPVPLAWENMVLKEADTAALNAFYRRLGFKSLMIPASGAQPHIVAPPALPPDDLFSEPAPKPAEPLPPARFASITSAAELRRVIQDFRARPGLFVFDTETDSLDTMKAELVGLSFCCERDAAFYVPIAHKTGPNVPLAEVRDIVGPVLSDPLIPKGGQNAKFDMNVLVRHGFVVAGLAEDTLLASYLIDPEGSHALDALAKRYLDHEMTSYGAVVKQGGTFADVPLDAATAYSADDARTTFALLNPLGAKLKETRLDGVYRDIEIPLVPVLSAMERNGVLVNRELLRELGGEFAARLGKLEKAIHVAAGLEFNVASTKQVADVLFNKLGLTPVKKTKTGFSTDVEVLEELAPLHEMPRLLLEHRTLAKLLSTYVVQLEALIVPATGRIHTTYNQAVVATGRLSSSDPNLQNIPARTPEGRRIREVFMAPKGHVLLSADYSQIELRLLAAFTEDEGLMSAYRRGEDIHRRTAAAVLGIPEDRVGERERSVAKTVNFGVIYGQGAFGLAKQLGIPRGEAQNFIDRFYNEFSGVRFYRERVLQDARRRGYVTTHLGRHRYLPDLTSRNRLAAQNAERAAFNTIFQGSAADLIKKAMIAIADRLEKEGSKARMILQVHDELVFEVPEKEITRVKELAVETMEGAFNLAVPLQVSSAHGPNWSAAH